MIFLDKQLVISVDGMESRVAVLEDKWLAELYVERQDARSIVGSIFKGRVENVLPGMDAAFVDIGLGKNGFLYVDEVSLPEDSDSRPRKISQLLKPGQELLVQVVKDAMGSKGPRLTTQLSIPGRYLVYVPDGKMCGVSRRLSDKERQRLRRLCRDLKPDDVGVIVRTAAEGVEDKAISGDLRFLENVWSTVQRRIEDLETPASVYSEAELPMRVVRDLFNEDFSRILLDDQETARRLEGFLQATTPELVGRVETHQGAKPLFDAYGIEEEISKALKSKVDLPSGGSLIIEQTEAMTVVDVNTGRYVGRKRLEDTIVKTNLEACREVVRQMRVRDIGGIIVIDFIDMSRKGNREQVLKTLDEELGKDRTKTYVVELSPLGLVEMTRQNVTDGLRGTMTVPCPTCKGAGVVLSPQTAAVNIERRLVGLAESSTSQAFVVDVHPSVADLIARDGGNIVQRLEKATGRLFMFEGASYLPIEAHRVSAEGSREVIQGIALPVTAGQELTLRVEEKHIYNGRDGVARIGDYCVVVIDGGDRIGSEVSVVVEEATSACALAHLQVK